MGILSVEEVAQMNEQTMQRLGMGAVALKSRANAWLQDKGGQINPEEVAQLRDTTVSQEQRIKDLEATIAKLGGKAK
jgi:hypothetical protein